MTTNFFSVFFEKTKNIFQIYFSNFILLFGVPFVFFLIMEFFSFLLLQIELPSKKIQTILLTPPTLFLIICLITLPFVFIFYVLSKQNRNKNKKYDWKKDSQEFFKISLQSLKTFSFLFFYLFAYPALAFAISMGSDFISSFLSQLLVTLSSIFLVVWFIIRVPKSFFAIPYAVEKQDFSWESWKNGLALTENAWWKTAFFLVELSCVALFLKMIFFFGKLGMIFIVNQLPSEVTPVFMQGYFLITQTFAFSFLTTIIFSKFISLNKK